MVKNIENAQNVKLTIKGVVSIDTNVDAKSLATLHADSTVLGVDMTPAFAVANLKQQNGIDPATVHVIPAPFYWVATEN